jgi:hypothetical protein
MTPTTSATSSSTTGSLPPIPIPDANASAVDSTARGRLSQPPAPTSVRLTSTLSEMKTSAKKHIEDLPKIEANLLLLAPNGMTSLDSQIEECTHPIPLLCEFYAKINKGIKSLRAKQKDQAREFFTQALQMIEKQEERHFLLARAFGTVKLASTFGRSDKNPFSSNALIQTFAVYLQKEELYVNDKSKLKALNLLSKSFNCLRKLFPVSSVFQPNIKKNLAECQMEINLLYRKKSNQVACRFKNCKTLCCFRIIKIRGQ